MFKTRLFALLAFLFIASASYSQDPIIDSLKTVLRNPKLHDTTRVSVMTGIMDHYTEIGYTGKDEYTAPLKAILDKKLKQKNLSKEEQKAYKFALGTWYYHQAAKIFTKENAPQVIRYFDLAIALFKEVGADEEQWTLVMNKGMILRNANRSKEAFDCYYAALKHNEQIKNPHGIAQVNTAIGLAHQELNETPKAITYYNRAANYYASIKNPDSSDLYEYMIVLGNLAVAYKDEHQPDKARPLFLKSIAIAEKIGNADNISAGMQGLGDMDMDDKNYEEAIKKYNKGLAAVTGPTQRAYILLGLWEAYFKTNRIAESKKYLLESRKSAELSQHPPLLSNVYGDLYVTYKALHEYQLALEMFEKHKTIKESMSMESAKDQLKQQQLKYTFEKRELNYKLAAEKKAAVKNNWLIGLSGMLLLLLFGVYFYYRNNKQKQAITVLEKDQMKQKLLVTQMNPHFIFNSIENIQHLIYDKKDHEAADYLTKFSMLTRQILEHSNENYIQLTEEVEMIKNYMAIQQLLYSNKFDFSISVDDSIDSETIFLPPMLTQPFIENAIKHGLSNREKNGMIDIHFYLRDSKLFFEVTDNGKGFDASKKTTNHKSLAMTITKERLIGYTKNQDFVVHTDNIVDKDTNIVGAKVSFEIPYIYEN